MDKEVKEIIKYLSKYCNLTQDAIDDISILEGYINIQQQKVEQLEKELKEANDSIAWWSNRFKAVERDNKQLENILNKGSNN